MAIVELVVLIINLIGLIILSLLFWQMSSHYNKLVSGLSEKTLKSLLEQSIKEIDTNKKDLDYLRKCVDKIEKEGTLHIQKIGLLRFNPFKDTGGDQSFILALLDANNSGVVLSSLYSRSGPRWYAKRIIGGKALDHELSDDEKKALKEVK